MYATKQEILGVIKFLRRDYTESSIDDSLQDLAATWIISELASHNIDPSPIGKTTEQLQLLKSAEISFYLELSGSVREIENAFGVISQEQSGDYMKRFENEMPMFFFAQGSSKSFLELLPHETWRMRGYKFIRQFIQLYFTQTRNTIRAGPQVMVDDW